jgi:nucleotide-binding universal stress UspA family protein
VMATGRRKPMYDRLLVAIDHSDATERVLAAASRGRSDIAGLVLGSTAHKVIHLADRPVLVVR